MARADPAPFDLAGPTLEVKVTHAGSTLPIAQAPNLSEGDQIWIKPDLPSGQSVRYVLVAAFLRGATNPPPLKWFHAWNTWGPKAGGGLTVTVPAGAQQVMLFLAPQTGGDVGTLIDSVRGRPGAFVRASQDLNQASLDRSRLDAFLAAIKKISETDPEHLKEASPLLARSLSIKLDQDCLQKVAEDQAPCLTKGPDSLVLNDGQSASIVQALTSGYSADLIQQLSATPQAGYGYFSPYVASVMDIARILDSFHTAQYQYIPALASARDDRLALLLNTPPSFKNPMSVLVVALPAVGPALPPPLHPVDPKAAYCLARGDLTLPAEGAPLVFSTGYAHGLALKLKLKDGQAVSLPVKADPEKGGLVFAGSGPGEAIKAAAIEGSIEGYWGFAPFTGPSFPLQTPEAVQWNATGDDQQPLIAGRDGQVKLAGATAACVESIALKAADGPDEKLTWKVLGPDKLEVAAPLKEARPGPVTLLVKQYGAATADAVSLQAYSQPADLDGFVFHAGDRAGVLKGRRLPEVVSLKLDGVLFKPETQDMAAGDELSMVAADPAATAKLAAGQKTQAKVMLKDGRTLKLEASVEPARPSVVLIDKTIQPAAAAFATPTGAPVVDLAGKDELPQGAALTFSIRAETPASFSGDEKVEVASDNGVVLTTLTASGGLTLADAHVLFARLDTSKPLGPAGFGALQFRVVEKGVAGEWRPLANLVRTPTLHRLRCPDQADQPCRLSGSDLFLISALSADADFAKAIQVPDGFTGDSTPAPHPADGELYVKLRDDPATVNRIVIATSPAPGKAEAEPAKAAPATAPKSS